MTSQAYWLSASLALGAFLKVCLAKQAPLPSLQEMHIAGCSACHAVLAVRLFILQGLSAEIALCIVTLLEHCYEQAETRLPKCLSAARMLHQSLSPDLQVGSAESLGNAAIQAAKQPSLLDRMF